MAIRMRMLLAVHEADSLLVAAISVHQPPVGACPEPQPVDLVVRHEDDVPPVRRVRRMFVVTIDGQTLTFTGWQVVAVDLVLPEIFRLVVAREQQRAAVARDVRRLVEGVSPWLNPPDIFKMWLGTFHEVCQFDCVEPGGSERAEDVDSLLTFGPQHLTSVRRELWQQHTL